MSHKLSEQEAQPNMSYAPRQSVFPNSATSSLRQPSLGSSNAQSQQSSVLQVRIASKRQELENLKQLRDLSGALANQIGAMETKLSTLRDGTEAVACVLANWDNVLRAISMASSTQTYLHLCWHRLIESKVKVTQPPSVDSQTRAEPDLPVTLVRIPAQPKEQNGINGE